MKFCHSCTAPIHLPEFQGASEIYCKYCSDESGNLKSAPEVQAGIAHWLESWQPDVDHDTAMARAAIFMKAMPAWAQGG